MILATDLGAQTAAAVPAETDQATAISPLRPAGIGRIDGSRVDVVSDGEFIEKNVQADTTTREAIGGTGGESPAGERPRVPEGRR